MQKDLQREVFGGSESELSSDEDDINRLEGRKPQRPSISHHHHHHQFSSEHGLAGASGAGYESSAGDSEDDYRDEDGPLKSSSQQNKRPVAGRSRRRSLTDGKPRQRKRKRSEIVEPDLSEMTPEQASKYRLNQQIEAIIKPQKSSRRGKKKANEEVLDKLADNEVSRLREMMSAAADEDQRANLEKMPGLAKLKLLPDAMETLQKASLAQSIIDNNLLEAVRRWLEPLPDHSLPALNIQREFFTILKKMEYIDSSVLKESGLGKVVLFYSKCKRVTPEIAKTANELVSIWSRPIIKRSASYRDKVIPVVSELGGADGEGGMGSQGIVRGEKLNAIMARAKETEKHRVKKNAVSIPQSQLGNYTVAPRANSGLAFGRTNASVDEDVERRKKNNERMRLLTRKVGGMAR